MHSAPQHLEMFADGIGEITVSGAVIRIDLVSLSATERDASNNPLPVFRQRVIMPLEGFANAVDLMQKVLQGLVDAGTVRRTPVPTHAPHSETSSTRLEPNGSAEPNRSPNFS